METDLKHDKDELASMDEAMAITSLSDKTIDRKCREGTFPAKVKIGRRTAFVRRELHEWVQLMIEARDAEVASRTARHFAGKRPTRQSKPISNIDMVTAQSFQAQRGGIHG